MAERTVPIARPEGVMQTFICHPDGPGPYPILVQLMDGLGMREELRDHARRAASWGYQVVAPDLYHSFGFDGPLDFADDAQRAKIMGAIRALTGRRVADDIEAVLATAGGPPAKDGPIGFYGFCMGGRLALEMAQLFGDRAGAAASIHPGMLVTEDETSPHRHLDAIAAELYFGIADKDAHATPEQMAALEKALRASDVEYRLEWHAGALHGFMMPSHAELYDQGAAETVWARLEALFARCL